MKKISLVLFIFSIFSVTLTAQTPSLLVRSGDQEEINRHQKTINELNYKKTIDELNEKIEIDQGNADLYMKRAANFAKLNNKEAVLKDVNTVLLLKPNDIDLLYEGAQQLYLSGQYEESIKIGDFLISMNNQRHSLGYKIRYLNRFKLKDYKGTIEDIIESREFFSAFDEGIKIYLDADNEMKHTQGLLSITLDNLKDDPNIFDYYDEIFNFLEENRNGGDHGSTMGSRFLWSRMWLSVNVSYAKVYEEKHNADEVKSFFDKIEIEQGLYTRSEIYKEMGKYDAAMNDLNKIIKNNQSNGILLMSRGSLYFLKKQYELALLDYKKALEIDPQLKLVVDKIVLTKRKLLEKTDQQKK